MQMRDQNRFDDSTNPDVWNNYMDGIDARIEAYAARTGERVDDNLEELGRDIRDWFDRQDLDDKARRDWEGLKLNSKLYANKVKHRFQELVDAGRIRIKHWTGAENE